MEFPPPGILRNPLTTLPDLDPSSRCLKPE